ncbi:MAG: DUF2946 domain-containing protein [Thauera sp.]|jgi:hypothetical protein
MQRFRQPLLAWIAIFAMALSALAPAVSRAMGPDANSRHVIQLCSAAGVEWVELSAEEAARYSEAGAVSGEHDRDTRPLLDHCPYCSAHFGSALLPPMVLSAVFAVVGSAVMPRLFLAAPRPLFAWSSSHPRAPPAHA